MRLDFSFLRLSLKAKLISDYLVILGIGGLATSLLGSWIVSSTIMMQAHRAVDHDLAMARSFYDQKLESSGAKSSARCLRNGHSATPCGRTRLPPGLSGFDP